MVSSVGNISTLFRSLAPDDSSFQASANTLAQENQQRWPLFKAISLARPEPTPELSAQEKQRWIGQGRSGSIAHKPALSLPTFNEELTLSLEKIAKQSTLEIEEPNVSNAHAKPKQEPLTDQGSELKQIAENHIDASAILPTLVAAASQFSGLPIVELNLEAEQPSFEHTAVLTAEVNRDLSDTNRADDSLQSLFGRIQRKGKEVVKLDEKSSSFFDRLRKQ